MGNLQFTYGTAPDVGPGCRLVRQDVQAALASEVSFHVVRKSYFNSAFTDGENRADNWFVKTIVRYGVQALVDMNN